MLNSQHRSGAHWFSALLIIVGLTYWVNGHAAPQPDGSQALSGSYKQAVASPIRTGEDRSADAKRKPLEFLQFTNMQPGMLAPDIAAGGGYTTQLPALAAGSKGKVWAQADKSRGLEKRLAELLPVDYYHVVFTLPEPTSTIACTNKAVVCRLLFEVAGKRCAPSPPTPGTLCTKWETMPDGFGQSSPGRGLLKHL